MNNQKLVPLKRGAILLAVVLGLVFSYTVSADRMGMGGHYGPGMMHGPFDELNLSDTQRQKIYDIQRQARKQQWDIMDKMRDEHLKIEKLMNAEKRNTRAIVAAYAPIYKLHEQMIRNGVATANSIDAVLTADQRKELREWRDEMHERNHGDDDDRHHRGMMGNYGHMGGRGMMDDDYGCAGYGGYGMMGGYGGMGMMGGYGGYGMMGGYGGMGMMGGYGGYGMMGGYGGMGMMGGHLGMLDLTEAQRDKIYDIQKETRKQQWEIREEMQEAMEKVSKLMHADKRDANAIVAAHKPLYKLNDKMVENRVNAANKIDAVLTKEQRQELREWQQRGRRHGGIGMGGMMMW
jgi:Spy/CpxP family protein refolding chaperone